MIVFNPRKSSRKRALSSFSPSCNFFCKFLSKKFASSKIMRTFASELRKDGSLI